MPEGVPDNKLDEVPNALGWRLGRSNSAILPKAGKSEQQAAATEQCDELTPLHVRHGDFLPYALLARRPTRALSLPHLQPCRRAARKSLGQT